MGFITFCPSFKLICLFYSTFLWTHSINNLILIFMLFHVHYSKTIPHSYDVYVAYLMTFHNNSIRVCLCWVRFTLHHHEGRTNLAFMLLNNFTTLLGSLSLPSLSCVARILVCRTNALWFPVQYTGIFIHKSQILATITSSNNSSSHSYNTKIRWRLYISTRDNM